MLKDLLNDIVKAGGEPFFAGGYVRDFIFGVPNKDVDIEVYGLHTEKLREVLSQYGSVDTVGNSFSVMKMRDGKGNEYDFSLPRRELKSGVGHKGFLIEGDPFMSKKEACSRRDYTINAMLQDPFTGEIFDFFDGQSDLKNKTLRATSERFSEDVLRPIRGIQFAGRFDMKMDAVTAEMCKSLRNEYHTISTDRIREEWIKWALKSEKPSSGLQVLIDTGWSVFYPEFHNNIGVKQNPKFHGEIFVELHTQYVCDEAVLIAKRENLSNDDRLVLVMSALLHDCAKYKTSYGNFPEIKSPGHPEVGAPMAEDFLKRIGIPGWVVNRVYKLVKNHMRHYNCATAKAVRKLSEDIEPSNINELCLLIEADYRGRGCTSSGLPFKAKKMLELSKEENVTYSKPKRLIEGKHLIELGLYPNPSFGVIIKEAYQQQIKGSFKDLEGGMAWLVENHQKILSEKIL